VAQFHHVGVPTKKAQPKETYIEGGKVHITDPNANPYKFEYLRFEQGSPLPKEVQSGPHVAFMVDNLDAALKGEKVIVQPFDAMPTLRVAFIVKDGVTVELMQAK
jgi:catechol 2,3-dioxygenase-like lactoylglutathione lyase family enzyme